MGVHPLIPETSASANSAIPATQDKSYNSISEKARRKKLKLSLILPTGAADSFTLVVNLGSHLGKPDSGLPLQRRPARFGCTQSNSRLDKVTIGFHCHKQ